MFDATDQALIAANARIMQLERDLALLGPVTTPTHGLLCASCVQDVSPNWTYCPYCGSQERNSATGERIRRQR
jgi:rRNA maturation endonuclease Nob1